MKYNFKFDWPLRSVSSAGQCLLNIPATTLLPSSNFLPGQIYSIDNQCKFQFGPQSSYSNCMVSNKIEIFS